MKNNRQLYLFFMGWIFLVLLIPILSIAEELFHTESSSISESTSLGWISSGNHESTHFDDGIYEVLTEANYWGVWPFYISKLQHQWEFDVTEGEMITFHMKAHCNLIEQEGFVFYYSTDSTNGLDGNWTFMDTCTIATTNDQTVTFELPSDTSGTVYIRVVDGVRALGTNQLDSIYIDYMFIRSEWGGSPEDAKAFNPEPPNQETGVSADSILSWSAGEGAVSHNVYLGTDPENLILVSEQQIDTTYDPGSLDNDTCYYWRIDEIDSANEIYTGDIWTFCVQEQVSVAVSDEQFGSGSISSGSYLDTQESDNVYEVLIEEQEGILIWKKSKLWRKWKFSDVTPGNNKAIFHIEAHRADTGEYDKFTFCYETDATENIPILTINKTSDDNSYQKVVINLPDGFSGPVYIYAVDSNHDKGKYYKDSLYIDHMYIKIEGEDKAIEPEPADKITWTYKKDKLKWTPMEGAASHNVYFGTDKNNLSSKGNQIETTYDPGTMEYNTWYYWRIDGIDDQGILHEGDIWSFYVPGLKEDPPDGLPIGGGYGYTDLFDNDNCDYYVDNKNALVDALNNAVSGEIIYIADNAEIDLTDQIALVIPAGVMVASGRGKSPDNEGALLYRSIPKDESSPTGYDESYFYEGAIFTINGANTRITGLRLRGPRAFYEPDYNQEKLIQGQPGSRDIILEEYLAFGTRGINGLNHSFEVDNCELSYFSYYCIKATDAPGQTPYIHHNYMHDCGGINGYGVMVGYGEPHVYANIIARCKHAISSSGCPDMSYTASYNIILGGVSTGNFDAQNFDVHGWNEALKKLDPDSIEAGDWVKIYNNTFSWTGEIRDGASIVIRGKPKYFSEIYNNWFFYNSINDAAVIQRYTHGNLSVTGNWIGIDQNPQDTWNRCNVP